MLLNVKLANGSWAEGYESNLSLAPQVLVSVLLAVIPRAREEDALHSDSASAK